MALASGKMIFESRHISQFYYSFEDCKTFKASLNTTSEDKLG